MGVVFYPYVYLLCRAAFVQQCACLVEVSRTLGAGPWRTFTAVALPSVRPALAAGLALVTMETLADFGTVSYFGVPTFTTGIYRAWFGMGEPTAAAQLSAVLLAFVLAVVLAERFARRGAQYHHTTRRYRTPGRVPLAGWRAALALALCALPVALGFGVPVTVLTVLALAQADLGGTLLPGLAVNSLTLAVLTAGLAVVMGMVLAYWERLRPTRAIRGAVRVAAMGYAVPGTVIAIGVLIPFAAFDNAVDGWMRDTFGVSTGLLLTGSIAALIFAYLVRFLAVSLHTMEASLSRVRPTMDDAARALGHGPASTLLRVHAPLMWSSMLTAGLVVFVDVMKELPATLVMRPFNFDTLAVQAYNLASDERLTEASTAALTIVAVGILPVIILSKTIARGRPGS
jgi:iron(III) transport system permease protein